MKIARPTAWVLSAVLATGCSAGDSEDVSAQDAQELAGGDQAAASEFDSTLFIAGNCTVAKVGPRHLLLAAHCVQDDAFNKVRGEFAKDAIIAVTNRKAVGPGSDGFIPVRIDHTVVHPSWRREWPNRPLDAKGRRSGVVVLGPGAPSDLALVVLTASATTKLAAIPVAEVDVAPVAPNEPLTIMGYGCENGLGRASPAGARLKIANTRAVPVSNVFSPGLTVDQGVNPAKVSRAYFFTPGHAQEPWGASLCPGDSGGPVYVKRGGAFRVVGVNAYYTFLKVNKSTSYANWHTRIDTHAPEGVSTWLTTELSR